jgi:hypothetical protein
MIYSSAARINTTPLGNGPHYFGVELEVECPKGDPQEQATRALSMFPRGFILCKCDGSLNCGFEIVTKPASLAVHKTNWREFCKRHGKRIGSYGYRSTGLHIHCSRAPLSRQQIGRMLVFINRLANRPFINALSQRSYWQYCEVKPEKTIDDVNGGDRYEALNLCNRSTVEFRLFKGNCRALAIFRALEFCDALIRFTARPFSDQTWKSVPQFCAYVRRNKGRWPYLDRFLRFRWKPYPKTRQRKTTTHNPRENRFICV